MKNPEFTGFSRRTLIQGSVVAGTAGLMLTRPQPASAAAADFAEVTPLWPAPQTAESPAITPPLAALVLNKAGFGPRPGDIAAFNALGGDDAARLAAWVDQQLNPTGSDPAVEDRLAALLLSSEPADQAAYDTIDKTAEQLWTDHARSSDWQTRNRPVWQMERLTLLRGAYSQWQLREVLYDFWFNHFNVFGREFPTSGMMPEYDRQMRQHLFGNFADMLTANAKTASMLYYLDNYANTWPHPNENYAREVLELHTLGAIENYYGPVDPGTVGNNSKGQRAGYTEIDVFQFARALTGWAVSDTTDGSPDTGAFIFRPNRHYNFSDGPIEVMDVTINSPGGGESDVTDVLDYLAGHYGTARFIAWKLCTRLIGDNPSEAIVSSTADEFYNRRFDNDQLKEVYRHVLLSSEFQTAWGDKVKRPIETLVRAMRAADVDFTIRLDDNVSNAVFGRLDDTGQYPFGYEPPTGYPDEREMWQGSGALIMSWRAITYMLRQSSLVNLAEQTNTGIPAVNDRTPDNIVDFWMDRALGYALENAVRDRIVQFITDQLSGAAGSPINTDTTNTGSSSTYQRIIRAVVGLILMSPDALRR
ncbi:DUF1800 domain-containing protein [Elongatibacter sediminis]|uniref:DUF1800 domain-containing protein n=1 Tax=Elongatibacter sediminis TaxID=3119006 RepID=A0AAW9R9Z2_9GAMM